MSKTSNALCHQCPMNSGEAIHVPSSVPSSPRLIIIGEAPGSAEAVVGKPFIGPSGRLMRYILSVCGMKDTEVMWTNVMACHSRRVLNGSEIKQAVACCTPRLRAEIAQFPGVPGLTLGNLAQSVFGVPSQYRWHRDGSGRYIMSAPHPASLMRASPEDVLEESSCLVHGVKKACTPRHEWPAPPAPYIVAAVSDLPEPDAPVFTRNDFVVVDVETGTLSWLTGGIILLGIAAAARLGEDPRECGTIAWIIPCEVLETPEVQDWVRRFVEINGERIGGHNVKFDFLFLKKELGVEPVFGWDTILAAHVYDSNWLRGLKDLAGFFFDAPGYGGLKFESASRLELMSYLTKDLHYTLMLAYQFRDLLTEAGQYEKFYKRVSIPVARELTRMEHRGIAIDMDFLREVKKKMLKESSELATRIMEGSGWVINTPGSALQCATFIYDKLKMPPCSVPGLHPRSTARAALEAIRGCHPVIDLLLEYRRVSKMLSSYINNLEEKARWDEATQTYRVHPTWLQFSVVTGRLSAHDPAIQTIPHVDDLEAAGYGKMVRDCLVASPGHLLVVVDGSQWELRVAACMSQDPVLLEAYRSGADVHGAVAERMFGPNWTKQQRHDTKRFVFSYLYGGTEQSSAQVFRLPRDVVSEVVARFNKEMERLVKFRGECFEEARRKRFLESRMGRRFHFPLVLSSNADAVRKGSINYPIQGAASDITLLALVRCAPLLREIGAHPIITVHDSIVVEAPVGREVQAARIVIDAMEGTGAEFYPEIPWKAEAECGERWGSLEPLVLNGKEA